MRFSFLFLVFFAFAIFGQTQQDINQTECIKFHKSDSLLNAIYSKVLSEYSKDTVFLLKFKKAQKNWKLLRDSDLNAMYPDTTPMFYGSVFPMCRCIFLNNRTEERIKYLKQWLDKTEEGNVCSGSIKIQ
jgi:uncharacterized protein YecT (DUF1311 family)